MRIHLVVVFALLFAGCTDQTLRDPDPVPDPGPDAVRFLVIGDTGTATSSQFDVAEAMAQVCAELGCDFVVLLGDAIYETGVASAADPQFDAKFERPYEGLAMPFYVVLGNHDYGGSGSGYDARKAAYYLDYAETSDRWTMPALNYVIEAGPVDLFALDSAPLTMRGTVAAPPGGSAAEQKAWLAGAIADSDATWKMTFAHHPYISNGVHGDAGSYDRTPGLGSTWQELLETTACGEVDFHLSGHDHDLQWLQPVASCGDTEFIISGAAAKQRGTGTNGHAAHFEAFFTYGFAWMQAEAAQLTVRFYNGDGGVLHHAVRQAPEPLT